MKNGCVTKDGKVILTLTNDYIYMYEKELDLWMRMCDNKYALSLQRNGKKRTQNDGFNSENINANDINNNGVNEINECKSSTQ